MPNSRSASKRIRSDAKKRLVNKSRKSQIVTFEKKFLLAVEGGKKDEATSLLNQCFAQLDKAAKSGVIKKAKADRKKSRLSLKLNK